MIRGDARRAGPPGLGVRRSGGGAIMAYERELTIEELEELLGGALNGLALAITELDTAKDLFARLEPNAAAAQRRRLAPTAH